LIRGDPRWRRREKNLAIFYHFTRKAALATLEFAFGYEVLDYSYTYGALEPAKFRVRSQP
jgi:hypothetical protein